MSITLTGMSEWVDARFPTSTPADGALKVCEEAGEVAQAINKDQGTERLGHELADTIIACCTTAHLAGIDIGDVVMARWAEVRAR